MKQIKRREMKQYRNYWTISSVEWEKCFCIRLLIWMFKIYLGHNFLDKYKKWYLEVNTDKQSLVIKDIGSL